MSVADRREFLRGVGAAGIGALAGCTTALTGGSLNDEFSKVGYSSYVRGGSWITAYKQAFKFYCEDKGYEYDIRPIQQSAQKQVQDIRDMTNADHDAIIVGVWSTGAAKDAIQYALDNDTVVVPTNADTANSNVPLYVGFSNYNGGHKCAVQMEKALRNQQPNRAGNDAYQVLNVRGIQGNQSANQRSQGFLDYMDGIDDIQVEKTILGKYSRSVALEKVQEYINANGPVDGIYSGNLSMGLGVMTALKNLDLLYKKSNEKHIVLTQMDGSPEVNPAIANGYIDAAVDQPNYFYNPIAVKYARKYYEADMSMDAIPKIGTTITKDEFDIKSHKHKGVQLWSEPIWSPAEIRKQNDHPWFETDSIVITEKNADAPFLWGNIWG